MTKLSNKTKKTLMSVLMLFAIFAVLVLGLVITMAVKNQWNMNSVVFYLREVIIGNFLGVNAFLIGSIVFIGYLLLGRGIKDAILGFIKSGIGILVLSIGSGVLVSMCKEVFSGISSLGTGVTSLDPYLGWTSSQKFLETINGQNLSAFISYALLIGFAINLVLVIFRRWTNVHSIMLTGHVMFQQAAMVVGGVTVSVFWSGAALTTGAQFGIIAISGVLLGLYWGVGSTATIKGSDVVTQGAGFCVGHQQMLGLSLAYKIGRFFGKKEQSAENLVLPKKLKVFEDNIFTQSLIMLVLFTILILILHFGKGGIVAPNYKWDGAGLLKQWKVDGNVFWVFNIFLGSLKLVGAILVIQTGVRMFVSELQQSFQGIVEKVAPSTVVAVDVAATYGFSSNSVTYGFVSGTIAQFIAVGLLIGLSKINFASGFRFEITIPLFITLFFNSGSIGVFANASGGYRAALAIPAIFGFFEIILSSVGLSLLKHGETLRQGANVAHVFGTGYIGMFDWNVVFAPLMGISSLNPYLGGALFGAAILVLMVGSQLIDSGRQSNPTFLQKLLNFKVTKYAH
ncbi:PTS ascorbate transporter subunit IIC [Mycoplasmopsis gallopavonis]|uniref:Ascorbate-specific PTS system EIIC component n=1 Tax=Mycoplasmopsis gallopavonis TaxID=76629 RepID=A0A449AZV7_9BACT|nr:PTS ascorbate transporter subunit IIC [Mycoplasmopsis gallopavonis]RIV16541.1 PTS ascorbate transporter subunit IIC [Mycoplasmopsis gallopavonis]VEU73079.1 Ascorbate-specific PTS system EIIC component [Mycoplasmopsis gallopavonis]